MNGKQYVTDAEIAAEIQRVAPGGTYADVKAAAEIVCQRLSSRDDHHAVATFREVLDRAEPPAGDRKAADKMFADLHRIGATLPIWEYDREKRLKVAKIVEDGFAAASGERDKEWAKAAREVTEIFAPEEHDCVCALAMLVREVKE